MLLFSFALTFLSQGWCQLSGPVIFFLDRTKIRFGFVVVVPRYQYVSKSDYHWSFVWVPTSSCIKFNNNTKVFIFFHCLLVQWSLSPPQHPFPWWGLLLTDIGLGTGIDQFITVSILKSFLLINRFNRDKISSSSSSLSVCAAVFISSEISLSMVQNRLLMLYLHTFSAHVYFVALKSHTKFWRYRYPL